MPSNVIQVPFTGGLKQSVADEYIDPSQNLLTVSNGVYAKDGAISKRLGAQAVVPITVPGDPAFGTPQRMVTRRNGGELAVINGDSLFSVSPLTGVEASRGLLPPCVATREHVIGGAQQAAGAATPALGSFAIAEGSGFRIVAYRNQLGSNTTGLTIASGTVYVSLYDSNGTIVINAQAVAVGNFLAPQVAIVGGFAYIFVGLANSGDIKGIALNLATLTFGAATTIVNDCLSGWENVFDVVPYVGATGLLMVYAQAAPGASSQPTAVRLESLPALTVTASFVISPAPVGLGVHLTTLVSASHNANFGAAWFAWEHETVTGPLLVIQAASYATTGWAQVAAPFNVTGSVANTSAAVGCVVLNATEAAVVTKYSAQTVTTSAVVVANSVLSVLGLGTTVGSPVLVSRPFIATAGGVTRCYALCAIAHGSIPGGSYTVSYLLLDLRSYETSQSFRVVATVAPRQGDVPWAVLGTANPDFRLVPTTAIGMPAAGTFRTLAGITGTEEEIQTANVEITSFVDVVTLDFTGSQAWSFCEANAESYISGGVPSSYDGSGVQEEGFFQWPQGPAAVVLAGSGGSLNSGGTNLPYTWAICYAAIDNAGQIHRSTFWEVTSAAPATNDKATLTIPPLPFSSRFSGSRSPFIEVYRNTQAAQTIFYFVTSVPCPALQVGGGAYPTAVTVVDGTADAIIQVNTLQYTTGGVLDAVNPPSFRHRIRHVERTWGIDDTGYVIWYTTNFGVSDAPYYNEALTLQFSDGPLTCLAELDGSLIAFSARDIWAVSGNGPPSTGQGSDLTTATAIPTPVGAMGWPGTIGFAGGVMFQASTGGMYLLDRGLNVTFQKDSQDLIKAGVTVVASSMVPGSTVLRFVLNTGTIVTYDWSFTPGRWATASYPAAVTCSAVVNGAWCEGDAAGNVYVEKTTASALPYFDTQPNGSSTWVTDLVKMASVKPGGSLQSAAQLDFIQGLTRMLDPADINLTVYFDYGAATETRTYHYGDLVANNATLGEFRATPSPANLQPMAVAISLSSSQPSGGIASTGQGHRWLGVAFQVSSIGPVYDKLASGVKQ